MTPEDHELLHFVVVMLTVAVFFYILSKTDG